MSVTVMCLFVSQGPPIPAALGRGALMQRLLAERQAEAAAAPVAPGDASLVRPAESASAAPATAAPTLPLGRYP